MTVVFLAHKGDCEAGCIEAGDEKSAAMWVILQKENGPVLESRHDRESFERTKFEDPHAGTFVSFSRERVEARIDDWKREQDHVARSEMTLKAHGLDDESVNARRRTLLEVHGLAPHGSAKYEGPSALETCPQCGGSGDAWSPEIGPIGMCGDTETVCPGCDGKGELSPQ